MKINVNAYADQLISHAAFGISSNAITGSLDSASINFREFKANDRSRLTQRPLQGVDGDQFHATYFSSGKME